MKQTEMSVAEVRAMYFDADALIINPIRLYRYQFRGDRYYYYEKPPEQTDSEPSLFPVVKPRICLAAGVTTVTNKTMPKSEFLTKWMAETGYNEAIAYRDERSKYGSLLHTMIAEFLINRSFDLDAIPDIVDGYIAKHKLNVNFEKWCSDYQSDMLSFAAFAIERNVKPLAIELSLVSPRLRIAGTLDLLCEMDDFETGFFGETYKSGEKKGEPKETKRTVRVLGIVDFKSGRTPNDDTHHHAAQLKLLEILLHEHMSTVYSIDIMEQKLKLFNWHPRKWRTKPSYQLMERTDDVTTEFVLRKCLDFFEYDKDPESKTSLRIGGIVSMGGGIESNYTVENIMEIIQSRVESGDIPPMEYESTDDYLKTEPVSEQSLEWNETDENPVETQQS